MKKLAVFVEGYTELLFIEKLILEIAGSHDIRIEQRKICGGRRVPRIIKTASSVEFMGQFRLRQLSKRMI